MGRRFLLDTHVVVEIATEGGVEALPARVRRLLEDPDVELLLSVASEIEVAIKTAIGKLSLTKQELSAVCASASISPYPLRQNHAAALFDLPPHHKDPFDRMILSTALSDDIPVISRDERFRKYKGVRVVW